MKIKVTKNYVDKFDKEMRLCGAILETTEERADELIKNGVAVKYTPLKATKTVNEEEE